MCDQMPSVKRGIQLSEDLGRQIVIRIVCDAGPISRELDGSSPKDEPTPATRKKWPFVSVSNKVIISERVFRELRDPLKSCFLKWKHSPELGMDFFVAGDRPPADSAISPEIPEGREDSVDRPTDAGNRVADECSTI